jgi:hypothetical protein
VRIKVVGGTARFDGRSLCETCRWSTVLRGVKSNEEIVECQQLSYRNQRVPFPVASCTHHMNRNHPRLRELEEIAWILRSDPLRQQVGFVRSSRLADEERYVLEED